MDLEIIYDELILLNYSYNDIKLIFLIKFDTDIEQLEFSKKRLGQEHFRNELIKRYDNKCVLTNSGVCDACHIIPFANSDNMFVDNGLLISKQHHNYFDNYIFSINPKTLRVEINYDNKLGIGKEDVFLNIIDNKYVEKIKHFPETIRYIAKHYQIFLTKFETIPLK